ncbi:hypothetical protein SAMN04488109_0561 [Chryseolinea serpens]|uniref:Uncharacterized protein n=1 Tax=Chryseolinea serpens TaxID=947013 RepID=A0A1M5KC16_9BACT|nr:hypothetical protein [Chryseolinea serpens]SHG50406.1 hypothetical protein SAMN04488109_0561 [Chryseolinea serpens]
MNALSNVNFKQGIVDYNTFDIDFSKPMHEQIWELNEDLVQVIYLHGTDTHVLDVGWYPGSESDGNAGFKIFVIKNQRWETPIFSKSARNESDFFSVLNEAIEIASVSASA